MSEQGITEVCVGSVHVLSTFGILNAKQDIAERKSSHDKLPLSSTRTIMVIFSTSVETVGNNKNDNSYDA